LAKLASGIPWLALGGGGYDLSAVARGWTLAYGVMLDVEWPDQLPGEIGQRLGTNDLRDTVNLEIADDVQRDARTFAGESTAAIKREVFPVHGLTV